MSDKRQFQIGDTTSKKQESTEPRETVAKLEQKIDEIVRTVAERIVPTIGQRAIVDSLQGLLPDALRVAVDEWRAALLHVRFCELRTWIDDKGKIRSPIPERATAGSSGYDLRYVPPKPVTGLQLRAQPAVSQAGIGVDPKGNVTIYPGCSALLPTGFAVAIPVNCEGQIRSRSGLASAGIVVDNSPGTIDSDYRVIETNWGTDTGSERRLPAEIKVLLRNHGTEAKTFAPGDRIAQLVFCEVFEIDAEIVPMLDWAETVDAASDRVGGFGSTGLGTQTSSNGGSGSKA